MKKKKIVALLLATSVIATSPALFTSPIMVFAEESEGTNLEVTAETSGEQIEVNTETIATNNSTIVTNEGTVENNNGTIITNNGIITNNYATVDKNNYVEGEGGIICGSITNNHGSIDVNDGKLTLNADDGKINSNNRYTESNSGSIEINNARVETNCGVVKENNGNITSNETDGNVETNNLHISNNKGTVETNNKSIATNNGTVKENAQNRTENGIQNAIITTNTNTGTVEVNNGQIHHNYGKIFTNDNIVDFNYEGGTIEDNNRYVGSNHSTVIIKDTNGENGKVKENMNPGIVEIILSEDKTAEEIDTIVKDKVTWNFGEIVIKNSEDEVQTTYYGISGNNGLTGKDHYGVFLDNVKENNTYTLSIPSGYGVDGTITLSKDYTDLEVIGDALEKNENGDYIVPVGTQFKITGRLEFIGKWYKILQSSGAIVEVVQDTSDDTPTQPTPVVKDFTTSVAGVEINSWEDVSTVMNTKVDSIITEPNSDVKLFKLELSKKQLTIPTSVVSNVATSKVDGLHCFIGDGDAITFIDNGTLGNYIPTDFTHTDKTTDDMKFINFTKPQAIGATVLLSTRVPVKNTPVAIWMLVDGKYELVGFDVSNETGNIAFPISSTGQFVLTY